LVAQDPFANSGQFYFSWGVDPDYEQRYLTQYVRLNPAIYASLATSRVGEVESTAMVMSYDEFTASRFYREWAQPQGYCDGLWAILEKSATAIASISILRHERMGLADDETRRRLGLLAPHFRRAVAIGKVIDLNNAATASLADALDGLADGIFLVDADARIVHVNARGHAMIAEGKFLKKIDGRLAAVDAQADQSLRDVFAAADAGDAAVGARGIALPLPARDGDRWVANVLPLTSGARRKAGIDYAAVAAVFVRKAALDLPSPLQTMAELFKLTPAELRVASAIIDIGGVPDVASVLGISETTVKTHLQHLFEKTGTNRQADFVKLVAGFATPLRQE
jgi:DNA-binding CsgD family transcriptional regulator/PAS domain-containing protein